MEPLLALDPGARAAAFKQYDHCRPGSSSCSPFLAIPARPADGYLRERPPDSLINAAILVYHLTDADLARALD